MGPQELQILRCRCGINIGYRFVEATCGQTFRNVESSEYSCTECASKLLQVLSLCKIPIGNSLERFHHEDKEAREQAHEETMTMNTNLIAIRDNGLAEE